MAENRQLLKVDSPRRSGKKQVFPRLLSVSDVVYVLLLKPASFFQNYKKKLAQFEFQHEKDT